MSEKKLMIKYMMKKRNRIVLFIICSVCIALILLIFSIGIGFLNGRNDDKQLQQSYIKDIAFKGTVSQVTNKDILIKIDTVSNSNVIFPTEYIPAFEFQISSKQTCLLLNRKRLKLYNIKVGNNVNKKAGTDSITIGSISYSLFD